MTYTTPAVSDLALLIGSGVTLDNARAALVLRMAEGSCKAIADPLPDGAENVVLSVAARVYGNPLSVSTETTGPYSATFPAGLTKQERNQLRKLASTGAFTIDPTPATAGPGNLWAQQPETIGELTTQPPFYGDFDQAP
jgi:hypothetical protein